MKFLTILARGIEGCGVTKNSIEFTKYINNLTEHTANCISNSDIKWNKQNVHENLITQIKFKKDLNLVKQYIDQHDILIFMCTPLKKSPDKIKDNFIEILQYAKNNNKFLIYCQFDHTKRSLGTNMYIQEKYQNIFEYFDIVFNHSKDNDFINKFIKPNNINIKNLICRGDYGIENLFGIDFQIIKNRYWKQFEEKTHKTISFIGRPTAWKGMWLFRDLHYNYFIKDNWISIIEGMDITMSTMLQLYTTKKDKIPRNDVNLKYLRESKDYINKENYQLQYNNPIYIFPAYINEYALNRLSKKQFGIELLTLKDYFCKDIIENAMFEIIATGCIPIFRKQWAELFIVKGKSLYSYGEQSGTVFLDENNITETLNLLNKLVNDKQLYEKYRNNAYNFYKKFYDVNSVYNKLLQVIISFYNKKDK